MRQMVGVTLKSAGYEVLEACDGREALNIAKEQAPVDLVITDINMPNMDGLTLVRELRMLPHYRGVPLLVLTTEASAEKKLEGKAAGATGWVVKPFSPDRLLATIARIVT
jgi:two-component system chemotaxis response regulator CheY